MATVLQKRNLIQVSSKKRQSCNLIKLMTTNATFAINASRAQGQLVNTNGKLY